MELEVYIYIQFSIRITQVYFHVISLHEIHGLFDILKFLSRYK